MLEIELALAKPVGVSKKFYLLDVVALSYGPHVTGTASTCAARVSAFDNLVDGSLPDVHRTPSLKRTVEKHASPPPSVSGEFLHFSFDLLPRALMTAL
jgi:hypothetical protein